jgi:hypothetical protein
MRTVALTCVLLAAVPSLSQNKPIGMTGVVLKPDGKPMEGAFVLIRDYQQADQGYISDRWESRTAADGSFSFAVPRGCYDIFVSANPQFLPLTRRLCAKPKHPSLRIKLRSDPHPFLLVQD